MRAGRRPSLTAEQEADLVAWYCSRVTVRAKAAELGIAETTLFNILARHGIGVGRTPHAKKVAEWRRSQRRAV